MIKPYYQDKWVTIYHGDCREILPQLDVRADLVLTDPPYGIAAASANFRSRGKLAPAKDYGNGKWDNMRVDRYLLSQVLNAADNIILFGGNYYTDWLPRTTAWVIWDKRVEDKYTSDFSDCEMIWTTFKHHPRMFRYLWQGFIREDMVNKDIRYHPTQKPEALISWLISKYAERDDLILDPFLGSGTTCYCAKKLNRKCIGIEIEEKYCEIAANRCRQEVMEFNV